MAVISGLLLLSGLAILLLAAVAALAPVNRREAFKAALFGVAVLMGGYVVGPGTHPELAKCTHEVEAASLQPTKSIAKPPVPAKTVTRSPPDSEQLAAEIEVERWKRRPPPGAPELVSCDTARNKNYCEGAQENFVHDDWRRAHHGDIERAANVAFCLADEDNCGVEANPVQSCAWDMAIIASGSPDVGETQADHMQVHCRDLDEASLAAAKVRALRLVTTLPAFHEPAD